MRVSINCCRIQVGYSIQDNRRDYTQADQQSPVASLFSRDSEPRIAAKADKKNLGRRQNRQRSFPALCVSNLKRTDAIAESWPPKISLAEQKMARTRSDPGNMRLFCYSMYKM
jgi:hypothetical protein